MIFRNIMIWLDFLFFIDIICEFVGVIWLYICYYYFKIYINFFFCFIKWMEYEWSGKGGLWVCFFEKLIFVLIIMKFYCFFYGFIFYFLFLFVFVVV